jgi:hypothetical protein
MPGFNVEVGFWEKRRKILTGGNRGNGEEEKTTQTEQLKIRIRD